MINPEFDEQFRNVSDEEEGYNQGAAFRHPDANFLLERRRKNASTTVGGKLPIYKGDTCVETFLAKFENCARYYQWDETDQSFQLRNALDGPAGQLLWGLGGNVSVDRVKQLLRQRFGK